jgi:hypothetical protein
MRYILIFLFVIFSYSNTIKATYNAKYGWFGTIAIAKGIFIKNQDNYKIIITMKTKGIVSSMTHHLMETYISEGKIINNRLIPTHYIMDIKKHGDDYYRIYIFDHQNKKVIKKKYQNGKLTSKEKYYYAPDDILSFYWNLPMYLKKEKKDVYTFHAIGGRKNDGRIDVTFLTSDELTKLQKTFKTKGLYIKLNLYNKIFSGDKGILYLVIDPTNWVTISGMVKNVLKFGDLKGKISKLDIE